MNTNSLAQENEITRIMLSMPKLYNKNLGLQHFLIITLITNAKSLNGF